MISHDNCKFRNLINQFPIKYNITRLRYFWFIYLDWIIVVVCSVPHSTFLVFQITNIMSTRFTSCIDSTTVFNYWYRLILANMIKCVPEKKELILLTNKPNIPDVDYICCFSFIFKHLETIWGLYSSAQKNYQEVCFIRICKWGSFDF